MLVYQHLPQIPPEFDKILYKGLHVVEMHDRKKKQLKSEIFHVQSGSNITGLANSTATKLEGTLILTGHRSFSTNY